jgi:hypothetical protein
VDYNAEERQASSVDTIVYGDPKVRGDDESSSCNTVSKLNTLNLLHDSLLITVDAIIICEIR